MKCKVDGCLNESNGNVFGDCDIHQNERIKKEVAQMMADDRKREEVEKLRRKAAGICYYPKCGQQATFSFSVEEVADICCDEHYKMLKDSSDRHPEDTPIKFKALFNKGSK